MVEKDRAAPPQLREYSGYRSGYIFDERGNVSQGLDKTGSIVSSDQYDAYGKATSTGGGDVYGFGGQFGYYTDTETGLLCLTHRYYDPGTGKFINRDPIGYKGGINLYGFAGNNPVNESDPSGFIPIPKLDAGNGIDWAKVGAVMTRFLRSGTIGRTAKSVIEEVGEAQEYQGLNPPSVAPINDGASPDARAAEEEAAEVQRTSPHYSVAFEAKLQRGVHYPGSSAPSHFAGANKQLHAHMEANPDYAQQMEHMYPGIGRAVAPGRRGAYSRQAPPGTSWHHHPTREGVLQLMPRDQHSSAGPLQAILHPGGRGGMENWGGGR